MVKKLLTAFMILALSVTAAVLFGPVPEAKQVTCPSCAGTGYLNRSDSGQETCARCMGSGVYNDGTKSTTLKNAGITYVDQGDFNDDFYDDDFYDDDEVFTYSITYVLNGGKDNSGNPNSYTSDSSTITLKKPTRKGYTFKGWYNEDGEKENTIPAGSNEDKIFYGEWSKNTYKITYQLYNGTNHKSNPKTYTVTSSITLKNPTRKGYAFKGWYSNKGLTKQVTKIATGSTGNITLYAKWSKSTYKITYKLNGGTNHKSNPKKYTVTTATVTLKNPTRKDYAFKGWYSDAKYKTKATKITKGSTGDKTFYAKWEKTYTIKYQLNGGKNHAKNPKTYTKSDAAIVLKNPTRNGCTFAGWFSDQKLTKKVTKIAKGSTGNKTLYAKWNLNTYKITYHLNGGTNNKGNPATYTAASATITLKNPTRKGYVFKGWFSDQKLTKKVTQIAKGSTGNKTLYAKWSIQTYTITYKLDSGTNNKKNPATYTVTTADITLSYPTKRGYTFNGWYRDAAFKKQVTKIAKGSTGNITLYAKWSKNTYLITYFLDNGTNNKNNPGSYTVTSADIILQNPTKKGYMLEGWYRDAAFKNPITKISKGSVGDLTLYAKWKKISLTYNFD